MDMNLSKFWELVMDREAWCTAIHGVAKPECVICGGFYIVGFELYKKPAVSIYWILLHYSPNVVHATPYK